MLFRPDIVLRDVPAEGTQGGGGNAEPAPAPPRSTGVQEGAAAQRSGGGATLDRGDTLKVEKKVGAEWAHAQIYKSKFREAAAAVAKAEVDAKIKQAKAKQNLDNAGQLDQFAAGLQQLENEALQSSLQNAHNIQQLGREVGSFRPRPGRIRHARHRPHASPRPRRRGARGCHHRAGDARRCDPRCGTGRRVADGGRRG